jgi:CheY-like chemotaxis protein
MAIDAQRGITLLYERYLIPEGYRFTACHDASQAVQEASTLQPAVILLDYQMPQINGLELTKALRHNNATAEIPIIIYSIKSASVLYEQALAAGASAFLQKPVFRQQLVKAIQKWVYGVK